MIRRRMSGARSIMASRYRKCGRNSWVKGVLDLACHRGSKGERLDHLPPLRFGRAPAFVSSLRSPTKARRGVPWRMKASGVPSPELPRRPARIFRIWAFCRKPMFAASAASGSFPIATKRPGHPLKVYGPSVYSPRMARRPVVVREYSPFRAWADEHWSEVERLAFIDHIARNPIDGAIIPDTGGVRKVRWKMPGQGKRGGARIIYYYYDASFPLCLLAAYAKARKADLSADEKRLMANFVQAIKQEARR